MRQQPAIVVDMTNTRNASITALKVTPAGEVEELTLDTRDVLAGLYGAIGCRAVDLVRITDVLDMWVDDEGLFVEEPRINYGACMVAVALGALRQPYFGTVVFACHDQEGDTTSLPPETVQVIRDVIGDGL